MHDNDIGDYYVECFVCGAETSDHRCEEPKHAAERWNRRAALTAQSANTLPLDEIPEGYSWESISSISRSGQVLFVLKSENKPMNVFSAYGPTPAEALRAAIAKVTP